MGRTTSNADSRSEATSSRRSSSDAVQVADLAGPDEGVSQRHRASAHPPRSSASSRAMTSGTWRRTAASSKQASRSASGSLAATAGRSPGARGAGPARRRRAGRCAGRWRRRPRATGRPSRRGPASTRDEACSPRPALDVLAHPLRPDDQALDQARRLRQHVVEQDRRVGQDHPLRGAVADVALVPQRLVLEARSARSRGAAGRGRRSAPTGSGCACGASPRSPSGRA